MQGKLKKLKDNNGQYVYPITRAEAVHVDNTGKTLDQKLNEIGTGGSGGSYTLPIASASTLGGIKVGNNLSIDSNGVLSTTGGGTVSANGRVYALFSLRGGIINAKKNTDDNTVVYTFPTLDTNRYRRLFVWKPAGGLLTIDFPDGQLLDNDALIYNMTSNTLVTRNGTWGNVTVAADEFLLLYNNLGNIGGILSEYLVYGYDNVSIPIREIEAENVATAGSVQGIFITSTYLVKCSHSNDEHTDWTGALTLMDKANPNTLLKSFTHNFGHMNAPSYSLVKDSLIVGNGSKSYSLLPKGWIFPNFSTVLANTASGSQLDWNTIDKIELDFTQFNGEYKGQLCWGYQSSDIVYLMTNDNRIIRKTQLGKGTNNLGSGVYVDGSATPNRYNGSYAVLDTWYSRTQDTMGGFVFSDGSLFTGIKGTNSIRKMSFNSNGYFDSEYIQIAGKTGDAQGIAIDGSYCYLYTDYKGYKFGVNELLGGGTTGSVTTIINPPSENQDITFATNKALYIVNEKDKQYLRALLKTEAGIKYAILGDSTEVGQGGVVSGHSLLAFSLITSDPGFIPLNGSKYLITYPTTTRHLEYYFLKKSDNPNISFTVTQKAYVKKTKFTVYYDAQPAYNRAAQFDIVINGVTYTIDTYAPAQTGNTTSTSNFRKATFDIPATQDITFTINNVRASASADPLQPDFYAPVFGFALGNGVDFNNLAVSSTTLKDSADNDLKGVSTSERLQKAYDMGANFISMGWGTNDSKGTYDAELFRTQLEQRIDEIRAYNPNTIILLNTDNRGEVGSAYQNNYVMNQVIREVAQNKEVNLLDEEALFDKFTGTTIDLVSDQIHPNSLGYYVIGETLAEMFGVDFVYKKYNQII